MVAALLVYSLRMTLKNIEQEAVHKFLVDVDAGTFQKALSSYLYGNKEDAISVMEQTSVGPKAREILNLEPVDAVEPLIKIWDEKAMAYADADSLNAALVATLRMKLEDIKDERVVKFLNNIEKEIPTKAYMTYTYGNKEDAISVMEQTSVGPKAREILKLEPVDAVLIKISNPNDKSIVSDEGVVKFLVDTLSMSSADVQLSKVQDYLATLDPQILNRVYAIYLNESLEAGMKAMYGATDSNNLNVADHSREIAKEVNAAPAEAEAAAAAPAEAALAE